MVNEIVEKILSESKLDRDTLKKRIKDKMSEFSGLVSEEGALYLIARDLNVDLPKKKKTSALKIENLLPGMRRVDLKARVVDVGKKNEFKKKDGTSGVVCNILLGDETGLTRLVLWDDQTELADKLKKNQAIEIKNAYSREGMMGVELRLGRATTVKKIDDTSVPEVSAQKGYGYERKNICELSEENLRCEIEGTVLDTFTSFFFTCPTCGVKVKEEEGVFSCEDHGEVKANRNLVVSAIVDDSTGNIRCVFFGDVAKKFLNVEYSEKPAKGDDVEKKKEFSKDASESQVFNDSEETNNVEEVVREKMGAEVILRGVTRYNSYSDRLEFICNDAKEMSLDELIELELQEAREEVKDRDG